MRGPRLWQLHKDGVRHERVQPKLEEVLSVAAQVIRGLVEKEANEEDNRR
jgi:hypothetical protein